MENINLAFSAHPILFYVCALVVGLCVGSFLNVVVYRLPQRLLQDWRQQASELLRGQHTEMPEEQQSQCPLCQHVHESRLTITLPEQYRFNLVWPPSHCPHCEAPIHWRDNVPILSYLWLGGKCRHCNSAISLQYPLIELLAGSLTPLLLWHFGLSGQFLGGLLLSYTLLTLTAIDWRHQLLPDDLTLALCWAGLLFNLSPTGFAPLPEAVLGAVFGYLLLWSVYHVFRLIAKKEGLGYGDFKLLAALGAWFGWQNLPLIVLISSLLGTCYGVALLIRRRKSVAFAFGPFLALAGLLHLFI